MPVTGFQKIFSFKETYTIIPGLGKQHMGIFTYGSRSFAFLYMMQDYCIVNDTNYDARSLYII